MNALSPLHEGVKPYGLVSFWIMYEIYAKHFVTAIQSLMALEKAIPTFESDEELANDENYIVIVININVLRSSCQALSAKLTLVAIDRFIELGKKGVSLLELEQELRIIRQRLQDELEGVYLIVLEEKHLDMFFGAHEMFEFDITEKFSSSMEEDFEEAGKCLALDRNTACVFHLMRAMEEAVKMLGATLGVANIDKEWGKLLSDLAAKIEAMPRSPLRDKWSACHVNLYHVKQAWRNSTMHPKETYTPEQAKEVFNAVRAFMHQLATLV